MKNALLLLFLALVFGACTPEPVISTGPSGTWTSTSRTQNGNNVLISGDTWEFNTCPDPSTGTCSGIYTVPYFFTTYTSNYTYRIYNNGSKLDMDFSSSSAVFQDINGADIVTNNATTIHITFTDTMNGNNDYYEHILTKQ